ncbi:MAG: S8 family peptidase [bacterium]|nr:S8 family peptidase [bacterium]
MKSIVVSIIAIAVVFALVPVNVEANEGGRKIVVFQAGLNETAKDEIVSRAGGAKLKNLDLIGARVIWLPSRAAVEKLKAQPGVLRVDDDVEVFALAPKGDAKGGPAQAQVLPWGIDRVDAELVWPSGNTANPIKVGIVDTGISKDHPDLRANIKGGVNTIRPGKSWNDDNGHGSHVAGTVGALNNTVGVVGVGPAVDLYAIKVLNAGGSGYLSDVIEGIEWGVTNNIKVLNMSLGTSSNIQSFHDAITAAYNAGVVLVAAAGNSGGSVIFPAAYSEVIAVSATDASNALAGFSSRGPEVDLSAPGVSVYSTHKRSGYATLSGTSMAAPHVAGAAALVLNTAVGTYDTDGDGAWDPAEVQAKLQTTATDLGDAGFDNLFGWGLVNAFSAVQ